MTLVVVGWLRVGGGRLILYINKFGKTQKSGVRALFSIILFFKIGMVLFSAIDCHLDDDDVDRQ